MKNRFCFNIFIQESITKHWDENAFTEYGGATLQYRDVARKIEKLHILFESSGLQKGEKVALCGHNSSGWACAFLAVLTYGAVAVPIQDGFKSEQIHNIVNHSDAKLLFVDETVKAFIDPKQMPALYGIISMSGYSLITSRRDTLTDGRERLNEIFGCRYPKYFRKEHIRYYMDEDPQELALINYTSGTTGFSKGVMLPYRSLWSNLDFFIGEIGDKMKDGQHVICMLPMSHMYGMVCEFLAGFCCGAHLYFWGRKPSPSYIVEMMGEVKPSMVITVPLIVEKIVRKKIFPQIQTPIIHLLLAMPVVGKRLKEHICQIVKNTFGGNLYEIIVGGAALNPEIEHFLLNIGFPLTVGYGTTETGPLIAYCDYKKFVAGSCGTPAKHMDVRIDSADATNIPGEILTRGLNVMLGYYKNDEATDNAIDDNQWLHTGDRGTISADGHIFIRGRIKDMLLCSNGQNVYPEEIENKLNTMAVVGESLVIQHGDRLIGLVHPDPDEVNAMGFTDEEVSQIMEHNRHMLNDTLPSFCQIAEIRLHKEEFEKTPKRSIKRYLYK